MSIDLCVLASGSAGNCSIVRTPRGLMLIDAGIGPRAAARRLQGSGVSIEDISAVCLTHLDRDHFSPGWVQTLLRIGTTVYCAGHYVEKLLEIARDNRLARQIRPFQLDPFEPLEELSVRPVPLAHDEQGSHGFLISGHGRRLGYATDLGRVPDHLIEAFKDLDVLAIESNYDPALQEASNRPWFLKRRIMGGKGHLSNEQALLAVRKILDQSHRQSRPLPVHIVLLHRSRDCNCPQLLRTLFSADARIAPRLVLAEQYSRTEWLRPGDRSALAGEQMLLRFG